MKQLTGELGGEAGRTVISSSEFIKAESRNRAAIRELEEEAPSLMQDPAVENALAPLEDLGL
ncbi:MAG TPA: hypothetical protein ENN69_09040 [Spirochaetia bacterium]|nr:hypothetical protein [Spirochaetia bacterium]